MTNHLFHYKARIVDVYDGDTVTAEFDLGFKISFVEKVRLYGINSPEISGAEREKGLEARDALRNWIWNKSVLIETIRDREGKYGRYLGIIHLYEQGEWININERLVNKGFAIEIDF